MSTETLQHPSEIRILVIDDDAEVLGTLEKQLSPLGTLDLCEDPSEALAKLQNETYTVVVSDFRMPGMNGIELLTHCAQTQPQCQRILLTAFSEFADLSESINKAQLNFLLAKPWEGSELVNTVKKAIKTYLLSHENLELRKMAWTDSLTGVSNNRYFWERLGSEMGRAKRYGRSLSLVMLDIDDFKQYNDQFGHQVGDDVLKKVATALATSLRTMDTMSRYGGEEFAIILPETSANIALDIAKRLMVQVKAKTGISISLGVAEFPAHAGDSHALVHEADRALLEAKRQGKYRAVLLPAKASNQEFGS
ncbi:MAG TPA: diguanylate cyclase [Bdellovibrionota bacterium]|nr:diguanylate cyclase [Bdellovibrionota bacterium]